MKYARFTDGFGSQANIHTLMDSSEFSIQPKVTVLCD